MKYIVRANNYNYNDENFYIEGAGAIAEVYDNRKEALQARDELNVDGIEDYDRLNDFIYHAPNEEEIREWLRKYYHEKFRITLDEEDEYMEDDVTIPDTATDEQKLEIINKIGIRFYEVFEYDTTTPMVELKSNPAFWGKMDYDPLAGESGRSFYFNEAEAVKYLSDSICNAFSASYPGTTGNLEQLSATPEILADVLASSPYLQYDKDTSTITSRYNGQDDDGTDLLKVISLLKVKPYTVHTFSFEEVQKLAGAASEPYRSPEQPNASSSAKPWWQFWK